MKYIRTKSGVYEVKGANLIIKSFTIYKGKRQCFVKEKDIIKQADTIEELCDEFVWMKEIVKKDTIERIKKNGSDYTVYGAIWTDRGLIYVAKMNDKGELELL